MPLRKGHLVRHKDDERRKGIVWSVDVNAPKHLGNYLVAWKPSNYLTQIHPSQLVLDDHPLRGRNVILEHAADDWMESL